ncbi:MAG: preprotein translocase subunit SecE [Elusimicrobiota bacterium]|nr:preprotein translocase subunit SecE [Endomicrobiia bacterium]MDW8165547.1 preprotein translocase subunit SecE [Elusimicrobiota bacterium]
MKKFFDSIIKFINESYIELKKVHWLSKKEVITSSIVVVVLIFIFSIYIGIIDFILARIVSFLLGGRR